MGALGSNFVPLNLKLIEGGALLSDFEKQLQLAQQELVAHVEKFGEAAGRAKASCQLEIVLKCTSTRDHHYEIEPKVKISLPGRPIYVTSAFAQQDRISGQLGLFVNDLGSSEGDPTQMRLPAHSPAEETADQE